MMVQDLRFFTVATSGVSSRSWTKPPTKMNGKVPRRLLAAERRRVLSEADAGEW